MTALDRRTLMAATVAGIATPTALGANRVGSQIDQFFRERLHPVCISGAPAKFDPDIVAFHPTQFRERAPECGLTIPPAVLTRADDLVE